MAAGYDGVKQQLQAPDPVELNIFHVEKSEQERLGITNLPRDLEMPSIRCPNLPS